MESCDDGLELCCPPIGYSCGTHKLFDFKIKSITQKSYLGIRYPPIEGSPVPTDEQAPYGAYPYQAV
jgi:hypothetical protein